MFDNVMLDVFVGLIFIFVLYSLLASAINEFVATILAYRHRMLELALEQMLDGKNISYYWWDKVANVFFLGYHKIAELSKRKRKINNSDFFKTCVINSPDSVQVKRRKLNKKAALFAANITNHPLYRRKAENSLLFKKPAYLSADAFSDIMIDVLVAASSIYQTGPILMKDITQYVNTKIENKDLKRILLLYIDQANGDLQRFKLLLENWFDDTMDRVSGWYKRQSNRILLIIGFLLALTFNVSTIEIVKELSADKNTREALVKNASDYVNKQYAKDMQNLNSVDTAEIKSKLRVIRSLYDTSIAQNNVLLGMGWGNYGNNQNLFGKITFVLSKTFDPWSRGFSWLRLLGFLITAFAISLGAPFWFDLLNKFVNLRVSGTKPEESTSNATSKTESLNKKPDPTAKG
jgi:hypothetical protein